MSHDQTPLSAGSCRVSMRRWWEINRTRVKSSEKRMPFSETRLTAGDSSHCQQQSLAAQQNTGHIYGRPAIGGGYCAILGAIC